MMIKKCRECGKSFAPLKPYFHTCSLCFYPKSIAPTPSDRRKGFNTDYDLCLGYELDVGGYEGFGW